MKRKILFITLCVATIVFTGCSKKETPAMSNNVEIKTTIEDKVITEEIEEPIENVTTETVENNQELIDESALTEEDVQLEEEVQNEENAVLEEVVGEDEADPSLSQERQDLLDSIFGDGEGSFGGEEIQYGGDMTDPNTEGGLKYAENDW